MILLYISQAWHQWITSSTVTQKETDLLYRCKNTFSHKVATESQDWLLQPQEVLPTQVSCPSQPTGLANTAQQSANYFLGGWMQPDHMNYLQVPQCTGHPGQCRSPNTLFFGLSTTSSSNWSYPCTWVSSIPCFWIEIREQHSQLYLWRCKTLKYTPADINVCRWVITPYSNHRPSSPGAHKNHLPTASESIHIRHTALQLQAANLLHLSINTLASHQAMTATLVTSDNQYLPAIQMLC